MKTKTPKLQSEEEYGGGGSDIVVGGCQESVPYISIVCCFVVAMPSVKRETERKVNAPVDTGPSPNSDERVNNPTEGANEPARESGSLHSIWNHLGSIH
ncbi:hypothetical protein T03_6824 [Trichinella britovi]|uniref:Uncharacterized protein n=1 Tax=Trichinella britovi TaxID=45882 RepID=A0A0V1AJE1_TRIBR|nr:hypothetical protein T03_6824 [Trichinella britovi]